MGVGGGGGLLQPPPLQIPKREPRLRPTHLSRSFCSMRSLNLYAPPPVAGMTLVSVLTRWSLMKSRQASM